MLGIAIEWWILYLLVVGIIVSVILMFSAVMGAMNRIERLLGRIAELASSTV